MIKRTQVETLAAALAAMVFSGNALAATAGQNLTVQVNLVSACTIAATKAINVTALDGRGNVSVTCSPGVTTPVINLGEGLGNSAGLGRRVAEVTASPVPAGRKLPERNPSDTVLVTVTF
jgi:hypothetical protein